MVYTCKGNVQYIYADLKLVQKPNNPYIFLFILESHYCKHGLCFSIDECAEINQENPLKPPTENKVLKNFLYIFKGKIKENMIH